MKQEKYGIAELISGFVLFEVGSTTLFQIGGKAGQDVWAAMAMAAGAGFFLLLMYWAIYRRDPDLDLFELCRKYWGKTAGSLLSALFVVYFAYEASRNLRDLGELASFVLLNRTPLVVIMLIGIAIVANSVRYGLRVVFLCTLVLFPFVVLSYMILISMIGGVGLMHFENMLPILENGLKPVWREVPNIIAFPFAQTVLFLVFFPGLKTGRKARKPILLAYAATAAFLLLVNQMNVLVLGPKLANAVTFPLLQVVQLIELVEVFERMDVLFVIVLFIGLGTKLLLFYIGAVKGCFRITGIDYNKWIFPVGIAIFGASLSSPNFSHHLWVGIDVVLKWYPLIQILAPALLFMTMLIKRKKSPQR
ncbi:endospore germination permease [Paenibacillus macerans]|uniref:GerAB/ArcD/ProY family transporter n=1 Tax=Paenibacillus macerans TaxID=44252 RepID=UPI002DB64CEF|nr:endospore germination permease [Paenibacillus macerans]MEC0333859.1 endospore germination permease [Paenibacillus macerans]